MYLKCNSERSRKGRKHFSVLVFISVILFNSQRDFLIMDFMFWYVGSYMFYTHGPNCWHPFLKKRFEGRLLQAASFSSFQGWSIEFRSWLIEGHFRIVQGVCSLLFFVLFCFLALGFRSLYGWRTHELWLRPSFLTQGSTFCSRVPW